MTRRIVLLFAIGALATGLLPTSASSSGAGAAGTSETEGILWNGTGLVRYVATIKHTFSGKDPYGVPATVTRTYKESAVYKLTGRIVGGLMVAQMTGSGSGTMRFAGGQSGVCNPTQDPYAEWKYSGPARVRVVYGGGRYYVIPQQVNANMRTVESGCGSPPTRTVVRPGPVPHYLVVAARGFAGSANAKVITGKQRAPIRVIEGYIQADEIAGTGTVSVQLITSSSSKGKIGG